MSEIHKIYNRLNWSSIITFFGTGLSWTGLPYLAVTETGESKSFSLLFLMQCLLAMIGNLYAGKGSDKWGAKPFLLFGSFMATISLCAGYILYGTVLTPIETIALIGVLTSFIASITTPALQSWLAQIIKELGGEYEVSYARRDTQVMLAKLLGFGLGPVIYGYCQKNALLIDALTFFLEFALILSISSSKNVLAKTQSIKSGMSLKYFLKNDSLVLLLLLGLTTGVIMYPFISVALGFLHATNSSSNLLISAFWFLASLSSVLANAMIVKLFRQTSNKRLLQLVSVLVSTLSIIFVMIFRNHPIGIILGFCCFTLANPLLMSIQKSNFIRDCEHEYLGRLMGANEFLFNLGATLAIFIFFIVNEVTVLSGLIVVSILRFVIVDKYYQGVVSNESRSSKKIELY